MGALVRWECVECEKSTLLDFFKFGGTATHFSANESVGVQLSESQIGSWIRRCGEERSWMWAHARNLGETDRVSGGDVRW